MSIPVITFDRAKRILHFNECSFSEEFMNVFGKGYSERVPAGSFVQVVTQDQCATSLHVIVKLPTPEELIREGLRLKWQYFKDRLKRRKLW